MSTALNARNTSSITGGPSFTLKNRLLRLAWRIVWTVLCSWTPPVLRDWRSMVLKAFGAQIGDRSDVRGSVKVWYPPHLILRDRSILADGVDCYNMAPIYIGSDTIVSQRAYLCAGTHDFEDPHFQLIARPIEIGDNVWVAAEAFVGPGVKIQEGVVLGARAVACSNLDPWLIYAGNPAKALRPRSTTGRRGKEG